MIPLLQTTNTVTELPTTNGPSSVVKRSRGFRTPGLGRRYWTDRDPGDRLGNIAAPRKNWRQLKLSGGDMGQGSTAGWGAHGEIGGIRQ